MWASNIYSIKVRLEKTTVSAAVSKENRTELRTPLSVRDSGLRFFMGRFSNKPPALLVTYEWLSLLSIQK